MQQRDSPMDNLNSDRGFDRGFETFRSGHVRRSSDNQPSLSQTNPLSFSRPISLTEQPEPVLHKVATVQDLHHLKTSRERWNFPEPKFFNRPSDLWTAEELPMHKQSIAYTMTQHSLMNFPNDIENTLREENQRLRTQNKELRGQLATIRNQLVDMSTSYETVRQQKERAVQQRDDLKRTLEKARLRVDEENKYAEQAMQQRNLYQQIADKLRKRVDLLLVENTNMREALDRLTDQGGQVRQLQSKFEGVRQQLAKLQRSIQDDDSDWQLHKHMWVQQRQYYHEIIRKLEFQVECLKGRGQ